MRRLLPRIERIRTSPLEGIRIQLNEEMALDLVGIIEALVSRVEGALYTHDPGIDASSRKAPIPRANCHTNGPSSFSTNYPCKWRSVVSSMLFEGLIEATEGISGRSFLY